jgi:hypothetical protein
MKRIFWIVLGAALAGPGCLPTSFQRQEQPKPLPPPAPAVPSPPAVTPDGITEANAGAKVADLRRELDYARTREVPASNDQ